MSITAPPASGLAAAAVAAATHVDPRVARSRAAVLAAAAELLTEIGFAGVTVEAIAQRSGVAKTTIYRHWPKPSLLVIDAFESLSEPCAEPDTGSLRRDLTEILDNLARMLTTSPAGRAMASMVDAAGRDPEIAALRRAFVRERRSAINRALERAAARGEIGPDVDPALVASMAGGALFYRHLVSHEPLSRDFRRRLADSIMLIVTADA